MKENKNLTIFSLPPRNRIRNGSFFENMPFGYLQNGNKRVKYNRDCMSVYIKKTGHKEVWTQQKA